MRIGMIAPLDLRVPPIGYGGTELVVSLLTDELVRRGHDVTLFASGDSITRARLVSVVDRFLRGSGRDIHLLNWMNAATCMEEAKSFDIIHNHTAVEGMALASLAETPMLTTLHNIYEGDALQLFQSYKGWHCAISESAKDLFPPKDQFAGVVYNGINATAYPFNAGPRDDYLIYLSRISPEKGAHLAAEAARRLGRRLIIAGNIHTETDRAYYEARVQPFVDGDMIRYVGEADHAMKRELLSHARCLLAPIEWPEPFGLFMVEAMACGTPVIAFRRGAAPEVVAHGVSGLLVDNVDEMTEAVRHIGEIDRQRCREHVRERFSVRRMTNGYLAAYQRILASGRELAVDDSSGLPAGAILSRATIGDVPGRGVTHARALRAMAEANTASSTALP